MRYYIIAGEASGDLHGSNLMRSISKLDHQADYRFWGGDEMLQVSDNIVTHYKEVAFMGFAEVVKHLPLILSKMKECKQDIQDYAPDKLILIDYPGFNLRIAEWAKSQGIEVIYYISPQIWAWKKNRGYKIKKIVDEMIVILPFEVDVYKDYGVNAKYVGHPLLDAIKRFKPDPDFRVKNGIDQRKILALLPGSRKQEIEKILPIMSAAVSRYSDRYDIVIAGSSHISRDLYNHASKFSNGTKANIVYGKTYDLLSNADLALVSSGTATLETALFKVPQIVCYKTSYISYAIGKRIIDLDYISLVNLISNREIVKELIQSDLNINSIHHELELLMSGKDTEMLNEYDQLIKLLGNSGASDKAAAIITGSK